MTLYKEKLDNVYVIRNSIDNKIIAVTDEYGLYNNAIDSSITGTVMDGIIDDTEAFQNYANGMPDGTTIIIPSGKILKISEVLITKFNVTITGGGVIDGTLFFKHKNYNTATNYLTQDFKVHNLTFINSQSAGQSAIKVGSSRVGRIYNCTFGDIRGDYRTGGLTTYKLYAAVYIPENTDNLFGQHVQRLRIYDNEYNNVDYFVKEDSTSGIVASLADSMIYHNSGMCTITHIDLHTVDGLTVEDNIMFFSGYLDQSAVKAYSVHINYGTTLHIHDNKFFETGLEALLLEACSDFTVHDNFYGYCGQRLESAAIRVTGTPYGGNYSSLGEIHNEVIREPTGAGIKIDAKAGKMTIRDNFIHRPNASDRYYGVPALATTKYGITMDGDILKVHTSNNEVNLGVWNFVTGIQGANRHSNNTSDFVGDGTGLSRETNMSVLSISGSETTISGSYRDIVNINQPSPVSITDITNFRTSKFLTIVFYNSNTTLVHNASKIRLAGGVNITPTAGDVITFWCEKNGVAKEVK